MSDWMMINKKTGEIRNPGEHIARQTKQRKQHAELVTKKRFNHGRDYIVSYIDPVRELSRKLTPAEAGALIKLLLHLRIKSEGVLIVNGKPAKKSDLARIVGVSRPTMNKYIDKLTEVGVMKVNEKRFVIAKEYHSMGHVEGGTFTKLYTVKTREIIDRLKLEEIGMLYNFLPYFHYTEYYLCENPDCDAEYEQINFIGQARLAEICGIDRKLVWERMKKLQKAGAVLITGTRNQTRYLVHPDLMFRQPEGKETEWTRAVRKLFADHERKVGRR